MAALPARSRASQGSGRVDGALSSDVGAARVSRISRSDGGEHHALGWCDLAIHTEIFEQFPDTESVVTAVFTDENGKTRLTVTALYPSLDVREAVIKSGMARGAAISYDRLEDVVAGLKAVAQVS